MSEPGAVPVSRLCSRTACASVKLVRVREAVVEYNPLAGDRDLGDIRQPLESVAVEGPVAVALPRIARMSRSSAV